MIKDNKDTKDTKQTYKFILKKSNYKDISFIGILKKLYRVHKLNKYQYKDSIKRIVNNKPLKNNVHSIAHFYLSTLKASKTKTTMKALNRQDNRKQYIRFMKINYQNQRYAVTIKKEKYLQIVYNKFLCNEYKDLMIKSIGVEFSKLMQRCQEEIIIW